MARTFAFCQVALSGALAFGGAFLGAGGPAWAQGGPPLKWAAHEMWPGADAHDEGVDIVYWYDPGLDRHWVFVTGFITEVDAQGQVVGTRMATFKYDAAFYDNGNPPLPEKRAFFPPDLQVPTDGIYKAVAMALDEFNGDIYITGQAKNPNASDQDYAIIRYDKNLVPLWDPPARYYNGPGNGDDIPADIGLNLGPMQADVVVVAGTSLGNGTAKDIATIALRASDGEPVVSAWPDVGWGDGVRRFDHTGGDDRAVELGGTYTQVTGSSIDQLNVVVGGTSWNGSDDDFVTIYWGLANGVKVWHRLVQEGGEDVATGLYVYGAYIYISGYSQAPQSGFAGPTDPNYDFFIRSYTFDGFGTERWSDRWNYTGAADYPMDIFAAPDGFNGPMRIWVAGGATMGSEVHAITLYYVEDDGVGKLEWEAAFAYVDGGVHYFNALTISEQGDILLTGAVDDGVEDAVLVVKYKWTGAPYEFAWRRVYGTRDGFDEGRAIVTALLPKLNIYTVGAAAFPNQISDLVTLRHEEE